MAEPRGTDRSFDRLRIRWCCGCSNRQDLAHLIQAARDGSQGAARALQAQRGKPPHEGHSRVLSDDPDTIVPRRSQACACCGASLHAALPAEVISVAELNRPGFSGGRLVWLRRPRLGPRPGHNSVPPPRREGLADWFEQPTVVEPVHPFQRGVLDRLKGPPRPASMDDLRLEQADHRLGESVIVRVATLPTEGSTPASAKRSVSGCSHIAIRDPSDRRGRCRRGAALVQGLLQGIEHEVGPAERDTRQPTIRRAKTSITKAA